MDKRLFWLFSLLESVIIDAKASVEIIFY
jgi:hypothetical protein